MKSLFVSHLPRCARVAAVLASWTFALAATSQAAVADSAARMGDLVQQHVTAQKFSGAVLVAKRGEVVFDRAYGFANREWDIPNTPATIFRIGFRVDTSRFNRSRAELAETFQVPAFCSWPAGCKSLDVSTPGRVNRRMLRSAVLIALAVVGSLRPLIADTVRVSADIEFLGAGRAEKLDLYSPATARAGQRSPALVWIHGGGWTGGTKTEARAKEICTILAEAGYVAVSIDYKLGDGAWPQNLLDCKNAVRFLRTNADRYHIDPNRIAVAGGSAGGHLALMVALTAGQSDLEPTAPYPAASSTVRCAITLYGVTNILTRQKTDASGNPTGERAPGSTVRVFGVTDETAPVLRLASPVTHVTRYAPPIFILHGKADTTVDYLQAEELAAALKTAGAPHELLLLDNVGHTFAFRTWGKKKLSPDLTPAVLRFLSEHNR